MSSTEALAAKFQKVIATSELPPLGPQRRAGTKSVAELTREIHAFFEREKIPSHVQPALRSAALLWHDHLDASHTISQNIHSADGSWLHGIMHRREPDYGNAKYWFRRVDPHEAFPVLAQRVTKLLQTDKTLLLARLVATGRWMPFVFVDEVEAAEERGDAATQQLLQSVQAAEFEVLVEHLFSKP